jgi:hypothetical protein
MAESPDNPYQSPEESTSDDRRRLPWHVKSALTCAIGGNIVALLNACLLFRYQVGEAVRPMDLSCNGLVIAVLTFTVVLPFAVATFRSGHLLWGAITLVLSLTPIFVGSVAVVIVGEVLNLEFKP